MGDACCTQRFQPIGGDIPPKIDFLEQEQRSAEIYREHARQKLARLDFAGALECLDAALALKPDYACALCERASFRQWLGHDGALQDVEAAIRLDPRDSDAWAVRGRLHAEEHQFELAAADVAEAILLASKTGDADLLGYRSALREQTGDWKGAAEDFAQACKTDVVWAAICRGEMRVAVGDVNGGMKDLHQIPERHQAHGYAQGGLLWAERKLPLVSNQTVAAN